MAAFWSVFMHPAVKSSIELIGVVVVLALLAWWRIIQKMQFKWLSDHQITQGTRIAKLEKDVEACHIERTAQAHIIGILEGKLQSLRYQVTLHSGAPKAVRLSVKSEGQIIGSTPNIEAVFGYAIQDVTSKSIFDILPQFNSFAAMEFNGSEWAHISDCVVKHGLVGDVLATMSVRQVSRKDTSGVTYIVDLTRQDGY